MMNEPRETLRQNIDQKRGREAWDNVHSIKTQSERLQDDKLQKEYRSLARGFNAMIQINGLGQTLGFFKAKGKDKDKQGRPAINAYFYLLGHLTHWMHAHFNTDITDYLSDQLASKNDGLLDWIMHAASSADYRHATTECLAFGSWLRRFAEAELKEPEAGEGQ
jgi:CRISPR-associated protein Cmr5